MVRIAAAPRLLVAALAMLAALTLATPATQADNSVQGSLAASPGLGTPSDTLWYFVGPSDGSTVTLTLTYTPNGATLDSTGQTYDNLIGFNVYGDNGQLFAMSELVGSGTRRFAFQSSSTHQYGVQVFNYAQRSAVTYTLALTGASLATPATATPTPNLFSTPTPAPTPTPLPSGAAPPVNIEPALVGVLRAAGDQVQGRLIGDLTNATQDYQVTATPDGSTITIQLSARQPTLIAGVQAGVNVYQMQAGVKVLIAVGLPALDNPAVSVASFPGSADGYGDFVAEVYNGAPGAALDYTLARS